MGAAAKKPEIQTTKKVKQEKAAFESLAYVGSEGEIAREVSRMPDTADAATVRDAACRLLVAVNGTVQRDGKEWKQGFSFGSVLMRLAQMFPGTKTTEKCLRWYLVRIRQADRTYERYAMPTRFERPKTRTTLTK